MTGHVFSACGLSASVLNMFIKPKQQNTAVTRPVVVVCQCETDTEMSVVEHTRKNSTWTTTDTHTHTHPHLLGSPV